MEILRARDLATLHLREGRANAIGPAFLEAFRAALDELEAQPPAALVVTGDGKRFSAGLDLAALGETTAAALDAFLLDFEETFLRFFLLPFPVVAAVDGHAVAGGCVLALAADLRIGAEGDYRLGLPEVRLGLSLPSAALEIVRAALAPGAFAGVALRGDTMSPAEALAAGVLDELVPEGALLAQAEERAAALARSPAAAFAQVKREFREPFAAAARAIGPRSRAGFRNLWFAPAAVERRREVLEGIRRK